MNTTQKDIGARLRQIRNIFDNGYKMQTPKFAEKLGETKFNIQNYERGIASIPNRLLVALYENGFNPSYILTGEGSMFADNGIGQQKKLKYETNETESNAAIVSSIDLTEMTIAELLKHPAAAGNLLIIKTNNEKSIDK